MTLWRLRDHEGVSITAYHNVAVADHLLEKTTPVTMRRRPAPRVIAGWSHYRIMSVPGPKRRSPKNGADCGDALNRKVSGLMSSLAVAFWLGIFNVYAMMRCDGLGAVAWPDCFTDLSWGPVSIVWETKLETNDERRNKRCRKAKVANI